MCVSGNSLSSWLSENSHRLKGQAYEKARGNTRNSVFPRAPEANARISQGCLSWEKHNVKIVSIANRRVFLQLEGHRSCSIHIQLSYSSVTFSPC